jgi:SAM domain (Sterile alpha motif)
MAAGDSTGLCTHIADIRGQCRIFGWAFISDLAHPGCPGVRSTTGGAARSAVDIEAWLKSRGLEQYEPAFRANAIDADVLPKLTAEDLKDLGITAVGHRRKLLEAIAALRTGAAEIDMTVPRIRRPLAADAERRQVTVLFADLVGYTRLSREIGAEEIHSLLDGFFAVVDGT